MLEICAELSASHLGQRNRAFDIAKAAADAGANLFKVQVWQPGTMTVDREYRLERGPWAGRRLFDLYDEAWTPWSWLPGLFAYCRELGMEPFGAAFDNASVDFLCDLGVDRLKIASFELVDLPLIRYMASKGKPMILSTGMATGDEAECAFWLARGPGILVQNEVTMLACTSAYPADASDANLKGMRGMFGGPFGLSDHTPGIGVACAAAALGASYIEKHLCLARADGGPDAGFSLEPAEFKQLVTECRRAVASVGEVRYGPKAGEDQSLRRSLWVVKRTEAGQPLILGDNIRTARPAFGLPCSTPLEGKTAARYLPENTPLTADCLA